jgi:hypothetical protein
MVALPSLLLRVVVFGSLAFSKVSLNKMGEVALPSLSATEIGLPVVVDCMVRSASVSLVLAVPFITVVAMDVVEDSS